jgi:hypothetical protein
MMSTAALREKLFFKEWIHSEIMLVYPKNLLIGVLCTPLTTHRSAPDLNAFTASLYMNVNKLRQPPRLRND